MVPLLRRARSATAVAAVPVGIAAAFALQAPVAQAAPAASSHQAAIAKLAVASRAQMMANRRHRYWNSPRMRAYRWAVRQKGHPYVYGGTGPGFDCSGLVME